MQIEHWFYIWLIGFIISWVLGKKIIREGESLEDFLEMFMWVAFCILWPICWPWYLIQRYWHEIKPPKFL